MAKARKHVMTPARKAALARAQRASAAKRRGKGKGKLAAANRKAQGPSKKRRVLYGAVGAAAYLIGYGIANRKR